MATLITGGAVLPLAPTARRRLLQPGAVLVDAGTIVAVGPPDEVAAHPVATGATVVDATGTAVIPGIHNCHLHSGLLRGTAENLALLDWLRTYVDPAHRALTPDIAEAASRLCYAEAVRSGTTSVMDMWRFLDRAAAVAEDLGLRATLVPYVCDEEGYDYFETLDTNRALLDRVGTGGRVRAWVGLEHLLYCTPRAYADAFRLAEEYGTHIHTHSSEQVLEVETIEARFGRRPIEELEARGTLEAGRCVIAHCVWLSDAELDILAATGTRVAHCPCSNMKLASGAAPVPAMWARGITVGLGSDGEKENNNLDLLEEMKFASLLQKLTTLDPATGNPWDVLAMATIEGARCLGLDGVTGSLEPGKRADVVVVDLRRLHTTPVLSGRDANVAEHLVFSANGADVRDVWVDGRRLVAGGELVGVDVGAVRADAQAAAEELFARRAALSPS
ncbi:MAG TPA: amidohydrolase [Acidimicrobiales bacterium]|nr:amidohydrolase [Acidimicrobiales bacterium]